MITRQDIQAEIIRLGSMIVSAKEYALYHLSDPASQRYINWCNSLIEQLEDSLASVPRLEQFPDDGPSAEADQGTRRTPTCQTR